MNSGQAKAGKREGPKGAKKNDGKRPDDQAKRGKPQVANLTDASAGAWDDIYSKKEPKMKAAKSEPFVAKPQAAS